MADLPERFRKGTLRGWIDSQQRLAAKAEDLTPYREGGTMYENQHDFLESARTSVPCLCKMLNAALDGLMAVAGADPKDSSGALSMMALSTLDRLVSMVPIGKEKP